jgi:hypothetical protein
MVAQGHSRHFERAPVTSVLTSTSDIALHRAKCRKGPEAKFAALPKTDII